VKKITTRTICRISRLQDRQLTIGLDVGHAGAEGRRSSIFPPIPKRASIGDYTSGELREPYNWVASDGQLRTHDEIADEMFAALPFSRRDSRIEGSLRDTIRRCDQVVRRS
jgi:hypothetical protein